MTVPSSSSLSAGISLLPVLLFVRLTYASESSVSPCGRLRPVCNRAASPTSRRSCAPAFSLTYRKASFSSVPREVKRSNGKRTSSSNFSSSVLPWVCAHLQQIAKRDPLCLWCLDDRRRGLETLLQ